MEDATEITIEVRVEDGTYWASVVEYPGVFASGVTEAELFDSLREGLRLVMDDGTDTSSDLALVDVTPESTTRTIHKTVVRI